MWIWPEIIMGVTLLTVILMSVMQCHKKSLWTMAMLGLAAAGVASVWGGGQGGTLVIDTLAYQLRLFVIVIGLVIGLAVRHWLLESKDLLGFVVLWLTSLGAMLVLVSAANLITMYMAVELMSLPLVVLVAFSRQGKDIASAWRYFIMSGFGTAVWLMGMVLLYGVTGSMDIATISQVIAQASYPLMSAEAASNWLLISAVCMMAGFAVKFGLCPMQRWVVDVYSHASWPALMVLSALPKIAVWVMMVRLIEATGSGTAQVWALLGWLIGGASLLYGTLMALSTRHVRSLLAYASIAQLGVVMLVSVSGGVDGLRAAGLFLMVYVVMAVSVIGVVFNIRKQGQEVASWDDMHGFYAHSKTTALMVSLLMFSMAGLPPWLAFIAKFDMIRALVSAGWWVSAVAVLLMSVVALGYYTRLIKAAYFLETQKPVAIHSRSVQHLWVTVLVFFVMLGLYPAPLINLVYRWF